MSLAIIIVAAVVAFIVTMACTQEETSVFTQDGREYGTGADGNLYPIRHGWRWWRDLAGIYLTAFVVVGGAAWLVWPSGPSGFLP